MRLDGYLLIGIAALGAGCVDQGFLANRKDAVAVVLGDFDDLTTSIVTLDIASEPWDGFIVQATYSPPDDRLMRDDLQLRAENLLTDTEDDLDLDNYGTVFVSSGTRGFGQVQYNDGTIADDGMIIDAALDNVCSFAKQGGLLVVTDWAYEIIEHCWPDNIEFVGDDLVVDDAQTGVANSAVAAAVNDAVLKEDLGDMVSLDYNYSAWSVIEGVGAGTEVLMSGDVEYQASSTESATTLTAAPLIVRFAVGESEGQVVYSTFHISPQNPSVQQALLLDGMTGLVRGGGGVADTGGTSGS